MKVTFVKYQIYFFLVQHHGKKSSKIGNMILKAIKIDKNEYKIFVPIDRHFFKNQQLVFNNEGV